MLQATPDRRPQPAARRSLIYTVLAEPGDVVYFRAGRPDHHGAVRRGRLHPARGPPVTFAAGQELHLDYKGAAPDVGVYETTPPKKGCGLLGAEALLTLALLRARRPARRSR